MSIETHQFYIQYANLPLAKRYIVLNFVDSGSLNMIGAYKRMKELDDIMRPMWLEQRKLLDIAEQGFKNLKTHD